MCFFLLFRHFDVFDFTVHKDKCAVSFHICQLKEESFFMHTSYLSSTCVHTCRICDITASLQPIMIQYVMGTLVSSVGDMCPAVKLLKHPYQQDHIQITAEKLTCFYDVITLWLKCTDRPQMGPDTLPI